MTDLSKLTAEDETALALLHARQEEMLARTISWAKVNTGSHHIEGLKAFLPLLVEAFSELDADVRPETGDPIPLIGADGSEQLIDTAPVLRVRARPDAAVQVIMSGHYDTVFPPGTFSEVSDLGGGKWNGPGLCDMKGGLVVMLEALKAFEAGPLKNKLGYQIVITPDEEIGNFASARALTEAAQSGAHIGMTYEPCLETGDLAGARKGSSIFDIVLHGRSAHAGRAKEEGRSALLAAAEMVVGLEGLNGQRDGVTVNVGKIDGGGAVNIVPDLAIVRLGARAPDQAGAEWCQEEIRKLYQRALSHDGITGHMHGSFYRPPKPRNDAQQALFDAVAGTARAIGLDLNFIDTGGVCEGNNIFAAGVPNVDTLGVRGGRIHSAEEFIMADSFAERSGLSVLLLNRLADGRIDAAGIKELMRKVA